ncbi:MAG: site-specific DNA-methyltransferase, partial [Bacteroidales bacterium]
MTNLFNELEKLLHGNEHYISEDGTLMKNKVVEAGLALNPDLIRLLLTHDGLKRNFFTEVDGLLVFDKVKFQKFIMNKRFLPDSYTSFKNKIGLVDDEGDFLADSKEVVLSFPYKDCVLEGGQTKEDAKRNEVFWNEILAPDEITRLTEPKVLTNFKRYTAEGEKEVSNVSINDNLIIKGNNLLALHTLKKNYAGKVKLIYIDPPFNTGNDSFQYNDTFNHSTWLTFMRNRLIVAKDYLRNDGLLFINLDDIETAYAKVLVDEIFGRDNFITTISVRSSTPSGTKTAHKTKTIIKQKDSILVYRRSPESTFNPQYTVRENWDKHYSKYLTEINGEYVLRNLVDVLFENGVIESKISIANLDIDNKKFKNFYLKHADKICRL